MLRKLDGLTMLLLATLFAAFLLFSCAAKQAPLEVTVTVPANYTGQISLDPCSARASADVVLDAKGTAPTSVCPQSGEAVTLKVVTADRSYRISPEEVTIQRAGDGLPVAIKAWLRGH